MTSSVVPTSFWLWRVSYNFVFHSLAEQVNCNDIDIRENIAFE